MSRSATGELRRGTSNTNERGSAANRRARKTWLLETYAADKNLWRIQYTRGDGLESSVAEDRHPPWTDLVLVLQTDELPACRCYRCGALLHFETLTVDRIIPGCHGGTYRRNNIRPACSSCNTETGAPLRRKGK